MNDINYEEEVNSVFELIIVGLFSILGFTTLMLMILTFNNRLNKYERYEKVAAQEQYEEAASHVYKFTPFQAYMMGYNVDPWGPDDSSLTWLNSRRPADYVTISKSIYSGDLITRNNMISGANGTNPSVRSILDNLMPGNDVANWYRNGELQLYWTDERSVYYDAVLEDGVTVWEHNRKDFKWVIELPNQHQ